MTLQSFCDASHSPHPIQIYCPHFKRTSLLRSHSGYLLIPSPLLVLRACRVQGSPTNHDARSVLLILHGVLKIPNLFRSC
ncbi:MAG: hypothetical protein ACKO96_45010, partial [Flammeovirgaceae bacterium]